MAAAGPAASAQAVPIGAQPQQPAPAAPVVAPEPSLQNLPPELKCARQASSLRLSASGQEIPEAFADNETIALRTWTCTNPKGSDFEAKLEALQRTNLALTHALAQKALGIFGIAEEAFSVTVNQLSGHDALGLKQLVEDGRQLGSAETQGGSFAQVMAGQLSQLLETQLLGGLGGGSIPDIRDAALLG